MTNARHARPNNTDTQRIALSVGEPAGIGPELVVRAAQRPWPVQLVAFADPGLLEDTASQLGLALELRGFDPRQAAQPQAAHTLQVAAEPLPQPVVAGQLDVANAGYVLNALERAAQACLQGDCDALVTAPLHKGVINDAGIPFTGHTEFLADLCAVPRVVMMLATNQLRVALVTTHLPLRAVADALTAERLEATIRITDQALREQFGIHRPTLQVLGLNPHAGEQGHLGDEELTLIGPTLDALRDQGLNLLGPTPADAAFTPRALQGVDAVIAMYHDQGLPVLKHAGFGSAVNITLGLPMVRCSVDHGTALDIAGQGQAQPGSLITAIELASQIAGQIAGPASTG